MSRTRAGRALRSASLVAVTVAAILVPTACSSNSSSTTTAPTLADPAATAKELVTSWLTALKTGTDLEAHMAPNYILQRADGTFATREQYLANPTKVDSFVIDDGVTAVQSGNTLSARWSLRISETANGINYTDVLAPRLTVFEWLDGEWRIVGYANFNPPK